MSGPFGDTRVSLAVDTGATRTVIRPSILRLVGYDPTVTAGRGRIVSATGVEVVPFVAVERLRFIGHTRGGMIVAAHELPARFEGDGLLGLDFFRGLVLTLDFARGLIDLDPPRRWWPPWR